MGHEQVEPKLYEIASAPRRLPEVFPAFPLQVQYRTAQAVSLWRPREYAPTIEITPHGDVRVPVEKAVDASHSQQQAAAQQVGLLLSDPLYWKALIPETIGSPDSAIRLAILYPLTQLPALQLESVRNALAVLAKDPVLPPEGVGTDWLHRFYQRCSPASLHRFSFGSELFRELYQYAMAKGEPFPTAQLQESVSQGIQQLTTHLGGERSLFYNQSEAEMPLAITAEHRSTDWIVWQNLCPDAEETALITFANIYPLDPAAFLRAVTFIHLQFEVDPSSEDNSVYLLRDAAARAEILLPSPRVGWNHL